MNTNSFLFFVLIVIFIVIVANILVYDFFGAVRNDINQLIGMFNGYSGSSEIDYVGGLKDKIKNLKKYPASKAEDYVRHQLQLITGKSFPTVNPAWLKYNNKTMELDGYNRQLSMGFEFQGPMHTIFDPRIEKYSDYKERIFKDQLKKKICEDKGTHLIVIDFRIPQGYINDYLRSRVYDICQKDPKIKNKLPYIARPPNYIMEQFYPAYILV